ncbi:MAG: PA4642 family protein [Hahellaceae bacterium]|nr:PA4642 family protein [Hahellaceae bacterium]
MSGGPSQPKVVDEDWSDERVVSFLSLKPFDATDPDYHVLCKAYEHMIEENFARFVSAFVAAGRNLNACNARGESFLTHVRQHRRSSGYAGILVNAGAR